MHIFEFVVTNNNKQAAPTEEIVRRGTARADRPLSAFVGAPPETLADYLMPTFQYAADIVPPEYAATTRVLYQATAGMRLLTTDQQQAIYDALYEGLVQRTDFVFQLERSDIATLTGDLEGYYGALAANYLHGTINTQLELLPNQNKDNSSNNQHNGVVGALDMGGSSTQIVFLPQHHPHYQSVHVQNDDDDDDDDTVCLMSITMPNTIVKSRWNVTWHEEMNTLVCYKEKTFLPCPIYPTVQISSGNACGPHGSPSGRP